MEKTETHAGDRFLSRKIKLLFDVVVASFILMVILPVFLIIWGIVALDDGPALYGQVRIGRNGVPFRCLKFRSMVTNSDAVLRQILETDEACRREWETTRKLSHDPRITMIGRFLRKTSLDEIPQLLNVIKGDMSLVGPRPVVEAELKYYGQYLRYYEAVRPGITGLWQVSGRSDTAYEERVKLDTYYVKNWNLALDLKILYRTIPAVMMQKGAR
ncbi:sugar transferase [Acetobacter sp.]|uniref:sugar transferase n=1 Tax=Acetobacter sp. TaxID=440 RepID=UPI0025C67C70|nr:sugar transferase [Acetobacter sp.]MCI1299093.1 sugar transferase [Acetobacter sp.]